jgi:hypothetical protein
MEANLIRADWEDLDSAELRMLLHMRIGGPGQYDSREGNPNTLYLPLARESCKIKIRFGKGGDIVRLEPGSAFDATEWEQLCEEINKSILSGPYRTGREYSFSRFRVLGSWRGLRSGVQIVPPPADAPLAPLEAADHPFVLEFPVKVSDVARITNHRRIRDHRRLTLLLNVLLRGGTSFEPPRAGHFWGGVPESSESKWVHQFFSPKLGPPIADALSPPANERLAEIGPDEYYSEIGHDGQGLRVPSDLDDSIHLYMQLSPADREKFDRAAFWMDVSSRQWTISISSSFTSLVAAVESLTDRGVVHRLYCRKCKSICQHEVPGATERFRAFFEKFAPGAARRKRRNEMYAARSGIVHGSDLMQIDQGRDFGWDPPGFNELELHRELWTLTRVALRNWLRNPGGNNQAGQRAEPNQRFIFGLAGTILALLGLRFLWRHHRS